MRGVNSFRNFSEICLRSKGIGNDPIALPSQDFRRLGEVSLELVAKNPIIWPLGAATARRDIVETTPTAGSEVFHLDQETKAMKKLFTIVLLVSAMAVIGCGEKKPAAKPAAPAAPAASKPAEPAAAPAAPAAAPAGEKK